MLLRSRLSLGKPQAFDKYPGSISLSSCSRSTSTPGDKYLVQRLLPAVLCTWKGTRSKPNPCMIACKTTYWRTIKANKPIIKITSAITHGKQTHPQTSLRSFQQYLPRLSSSQQPTAEIQDKCSRSVYF